MQLYAVVCVVGQGHSGQSGGWLCVHMLTKSLHTRLWISPEIALSNGSCLVSSLPLHMDLLHSSSSNVTEAVIVAQPEQMMHVVPRPACFAVGALQQQPAVAELA